MDGLSSSALRLSPSGLDEFSCRYLPRGVEAISAFCRGQLRLSGSDNASNQRCKQHPGDVPGSLVIKSLDTVLLRDGDDCLFTYTTLSSGSELTDDAINAVPLLAQRALEEKSDLRVTVVGDDVFAVRILSQGVGITGDWRVVPKANLEYQDIVLDNEIAARCHLLVRRLGLSFAAIDLIETPHGTFFIEVNPTGEWGWLSTAERPIDRAIASWLGNPPKGVD